MLFGPPVMFKLELLGLGSSLVETWFPSLFSLSLELFSLLSFPLVALMLSFVSCSLRLVQ